MSEFTPIETQEQLDKVIGERVKRAERQAAEKYADYDAVKAQNAELSTKLSQLTEELKKQAETISGHDAIVADLNSKIHGYETDSVKTKVALELGLPYQMASRLTGDDEAAIRADAESMVKLIGAQKPAAPMGSPEPNSTNKGGTGVSSLWAAVSSQINE